MNHEQQLFFSRALADMLSLESKEDQAKQGKAIKAWSDAEGIPHQVYLRALINEAGHYLVIMSKLAEFGGVE